MPHRAHEPNDAFPALLRTWRVQRGMSQLDLALSAGVSTRHISFLETGRASPSREMVRTLSSALALTLRARNALLQAAGFAPAHAETDLAAREMEDVREALRLILQQQEPFGAVVLDRSSDILMMNRAYLRVLSQIGRGGQPPYELLPAPRENLLRLLLAPDGLRRVIVNFAEVAHAVLSRVDEALLMLPDAVLAERLAALLKEADLPARAPDAAAQDEPPSLLIPVELALGELRLRLFSTITTLGTAQDITLQELRIETFYPADEATLRLARQLAELGRP